ncbi:hypothetical protein CW712_05865 [Candidatus Bathyarchaeota archaeon]|nr:MAG: hypothetical protein CW712_05865 [Candidatus Bathyarchaeota archaeon]
MNFWGRMMLFLGVDSGATKTTCVITNEKLEVLGVGMAGASNYHIVGVKKAKENVKLAIEHARLCGNLKDKKIDVGCFGMGGLRTKKDSEVISNFIKSLDVAKELLIVNDAVTAYYAATLGKPGVVVVAGTGSIAYGTDGKGNEALLGGWGWLIGDEGSAFYIARQALMQATKAVDSRAKPTSLVRLAKKHFGILNFDEIITVVYHNLPAPQAIASFAKLVSVAAQHGDEVAKEIMIGASKELAILAESTVRKLNIINQPIIIGGVGSVWQSSIVWKVFEAELKKKFPPATFKKIKFPVVGSIVMGLIKKGVKISRNKADRLEKDIYLKIEREVNLGKFNTTS